MEGGEGGTTESKTKGKGTSGWESHWEELESNGVGAMVESG